MTTAIQDRQEPQPPHSAPSPASVAERVSILSASLARVRPAGMSDDAAHEWLTVCATDVAHLPATVLQQAAREAGRIVTHHGQIIPAILGSFTVKRHEQHERTVRQLQRDGHSLPGRSAPALTDRRGGSKQIGSIKAIEDHRG